MYAAKPYENDTLMTAMLKAEETNSLGPLIKEELKLTILKRRHMSGQGDIPLEVEKPKVSRQLTPAEVQKKLKRKEQNRRAAQRCREKKKRKAEDVLAEYQQEVQNSEKLKQELEQLRKEKEHLQRFIEDHAFTCNRITPNPTPSYEDNPSFVFPDTFGSGDIMCDDPFDALGYSPANCKPEEGEITVQSAPGDNVLLDQLDEILLPADFHDYCAGLETEPGRTSVSEYL